MDDYPLNVEEFTYLGSLLSKDNACSKDINIKLEKARSTVASLQPIWKSKRYRLKTRLRIYNSNVKSVLPYGPESW